MHVMRRIRVVAVSAVLLWSLGVAWAADGWLILERSGTAQLPEIVSVIDKMPAQSTLAKFPVLLEVKWGYKALPNGMPTEEELAHARELYAGLERIIGEGGLHAMTRTGDCERTMYYYVASAERHAAAIREFFDAQPPIAVRVIARTEADWVSVRKVLDAIK